MGQRHQIYIVVKTTDNKYKALGAWHHQWTYGMTATVNIARLYKLISNGIENKIYSIMDNRYLDTAVKAVYGVSLHDELSIVHNETNEDYLIDASGNITPENGDNNDGCSLIVIDEKKKKVRACLFTPNHLEGEHYKTSHGKNKALTLNKYLSYYYTPEQQANKGFINTWRDGLNLLNTITVKPVSTAELKRIISKENALPELITNVTKLIIGD